MHNNSNKGIIKLALARCGFYIIIVSMWESLIVQ